VKHDADNEAIAELISEPLKVPRVAQCWRRRRLDLDGDDPSVGYSAMTSISRRPSSVRKWCVVTSPGIWSRHNFRRRLTAAWCLLAAAIRTLLDTDGG